MTRTGQANGLSSPASEYRRWSAPAGPTRGYTPAEAWKVSATSVPEHEWLYTHGRGKWETFYNSEAQAVQLRFFDCSLKGTDSGMLEVRRAFYAQEVRGEADWPLRHYDTSAASGCDQRLARRESGPQ